MKIYKIKTAQKRGENYATMIIINRETGETLGEYRLTAGDERREIAAMRRALDKHLHGNNALGNYQW